MSSSGHRSGARFAWLVAVRGACGSAFFELARKLRLTTGQLCIESHFGRYLACRARRTLAGHSCANLSLQLPLRRCFGLGLACAGRLQKPRTGQLTGKRAAQGPPLQQCAERRAADEQTRKKRREKKQRQAQEAEEEKNAAETARVDLQ